MSKFPRCCVSFSDKLPTPLSLSSLSLREAVVVLSVSSLEDPRLNIGMLASRGEDKCHICEGRRPFTISLKHLSFQKIIVMLYTNFALYIFGFKPFSVFAGTTSLSSFQLSSPWCPPGRPGAGCLPCHYIHYSGKGYTGIKSVFFTKTPAISLRIKPLFR
jgi:hypothetical protein